MKNTNANENRGPGRPVYQPKFPAKIKWSFQDFMAVNGVNKTTGKGDNCSKGTLTKNLDRDMYAKIPTGRNAGKPDRNAPIKTSKVVKLDETRAPDCESGLGRRVFVYCLRAKLDQIKPAKEPVSVKTPKVKAAKKSAGYEFQKAALLATDPTPIINITPEPTSVEVVETSLETVEVAPITTTEPVTAEAAQTVEPVAA